MKVRPYGDVILGPGSKGATRPPPLEEDLKIKYDALRRENQSLLRENIELRARLNAMGSVQPQKVATRSIAVQAATSAECKLPKVDHYAQTIELPEPRPRCFPRSVQTEPEPPRAPPMPPAAPPPPPQPSRDSETQCFVPYTRATASQTSRVEHRTVGSQAFVAIWGKDVACGTDFDDEGESQTRRELLAKIDKLLVEVNQSKERQLREATGSSQLKSSLQWMEKRWSRILLVRDKFSEVHSDETCFGCGNMAEARARASWLSKVLGMCERGDWDIVVAPSFEEHLRLTCTGQARPPALEQADIAAVSAVVQGGAQSGGGNGPLSYNALSRGLLFNAVGASQGTDSSAAPVSMAQRLRSKSSRTSRINFQFRGNVGGAM